MPTVLRKPIVWIPLLLLALVAAVVFASRWFVPNIVRSQADAYMAKNLPGRQVKMGAVSFDPFSLTLGIADLAVGRAGQPPMVEVRKLTVDAAAASVFRLQPRLDSVVVEGAVVDAVLRKDGSLNLVELVPPDDGTPIPEVWIGSLQVSDSVVSFTDARRAVPVAKLLRPVAFELKDFSTTASEGGGFKLTAASEQGERFQWDGRFAMAPLASAGSFSVADLELATIGRFAGDMLPVSLGGGALNVTGTYRFAAAAVPAAGSKAAPAPMMFEADVTGLRVDNAALVTADGDSVSVKAVTLAPTKFSAGGDALALGALKLEGIVLGRPTGESVRVEAVTLEPTRYTVSSGVAELGAAAVNGVAVKGRGAKAAAVTLAGLAVAPSRIDTPKQLADIGAVSARGLRVAGEVTAKNELRVPGLYPLPAAKPAPKSAGPGWKVRLAGFDLEDAGVKLAVARPGGAKMLNFAPMRLKTGPVTSALDAPLNLDFSTGINGRAKASAKGRYEPRSGAADMAVDVAGLPIPELMAFAPPLPGVVVVKGTAGGKGQLKVRMAKAGPQVGFAGDAHLADFELDEKVGGDLVSWRRLDLSGMRYDPAPAKLAIRRVTFDRPVSTIVLTRQAQLNVARAAGVAAPVAEQPAVTVASGEKATDAALAAVEDVAATREAKPPEKGEAARVKVVAPISSSVAAAGQMIPISIEQVRVMNGVIGFEDLSVDPSFAVKILGFTGTVSGLSTRPGSQARFDLKGYVIDRFSPVSITGRANVFAYDANTDLQASFRNIELPVFNPYSGRFAGYAIAKGKLSTEISYRIVNRQLDANHNVVIEQLEWGEATDSKDKVSLPIRMATSLLKDKDGVIDLDLPVGGTLDDPTFKIWPVIWQVVGNVMTKLVTAPFKLIGSLFEGADKAQFIAFDPGSALLSPEASKDLASLAKGLVDRKEVNLEIPAGPGIREDADAMTIVALEKAALAAKKGNAAGFAELDPDAQADRLKAVYKAKFGKGPKFPEGEVAKAGMLAGGEAKKEAAAAQVDWLLAELKPKFAPTDAELAALGQARASAVKEALLGEGVLDPGRVFLSTNATVKAKDDRVEMEIGVK